MVELKEISAVVDCGTVIHPSAAQGQVEGAVTQGIGLAMTEYFDWHNGTPTDPQYIDYPLPSAEFVPKIHVAFADSYEPSGPFGAKGLGEIGLDAIPAAIANAIADAVGVRIYQLPITAEKIHRALHPELYTDEKVAPAAPPKGGVWTRLATGRPSGTRPYAMELVTPKTVDEAIALYAAGDTAIVSGGMSHALRRERTGFPQAKRLMHVGRIAELLQAGIAGNGMLRAGAAVNQQTLHELPQLRERWAVRQEDLEVASFEEEAKHVVVLPKLQYAEFHTVRAQFHWQEQSGVGAEGQNRQPLLNTVTAGVRVRVRPLEPMAT